MRRLRSFRFSAIKPCHNDSTVSGISKPIVVIGAYRSGTSRLAMALSSLGVYFGGEGDLFKGDQYNQQGYWEHKLIAKINRGMLLSLNVAQFDIDPIPDHWLSFPTSERRVRQFSDLIQSGFSGHSLWGWKDPETSLLMPFTKEVLSRVGVTGHYVICVRNPIEVAASQRRRVGADDSQTLGGWLRRTLGALAGTVGETKTVVMFDELQTSASTVIQRIVEGHEGWSPQDREIGAAIATQRPELVNERASGDMDRHLPYIVSRTYELCNDLASNQAVFRRGHFDSQILQLDEELRQVHAMSRRGEQQPGMLHATWQDAGERRELQVPFEAKRDWVVVEAEIPAPSGTALFLSIYQMPATIWIRSASWLGSGAEVPAELGGGSHGILVEDDGIKRLWPRFGQDQMRLTTLSGADKLRLEIMVETSPLSVATHWRGLSEQLDAALAHRP